MSHQPPMEQFYEFRYSSQSQPQQYAPYGGSTAPDRSRAQPNYQSQPLPRNEYDTPVARSEARFESPRADYATSAPYRPAQQRTPAQQTTLATRHALPAAHSAQQSLDYGSAPNAYPPLVQKRSSSSDTITGPPEKENWASKKHKTAFGDYTIRGVFALKYLKYWIILIVILVAVSLFTIYHHQIVNWLRPKAEQLQDIPAGWLIPVGVLFVISFPPLFGHEIVAVLCGLVYGLWIGFGIVALGSFLGELGNWFLFRYLLREKAKKRELTDVTYASMARVIKDGGFKVVLYARLSAIPGHLTTPLFAVSDMTLWIFVISAILSTPKQLLPVYLGTIFDDEETGNRSTASKIVQYVIVGFGLLLTVYTCWYIYAELKRVRPIVEAEFEQRKLEGATVEVTTTKEVKETPTSTFALPHRSANRSSRDYARFGQQRDATESTANLHEDPYAGYDPHEEQDMHLAPYSDPHANLSAYSINEPPRIHSPAPTYTAHYQQPVYPTQTPQYGPPAPINYSRPVRDTQNYGR